MRRAGLETAARYSAGGAFSAERSDNVTRKCSRTTLPCLEQVKYIPNVAALRTVKATGHAL